jgi:class 3 adenylate cyclase/tetratricopeptide (TPR) repeat protein
MICSACGAEAAPGERFCGQCGTTLAASCPNCGHTNPADHRFCGSCGTRLETSPAPEAAPTTERRLVSVLFVDLVGFTTFSESRDPEEVRALITDYFDLARAVVERFGGTVDKFIGDAVMAWWGAATSREDDAERAVRAALELVDRVVFLGQEKGIADLAARAGVMTGEAAVGPGGNEQGLLLGDLVNSASRLQSAAEPGSVLVGDLAAGLVDSAIEFAPPESYKVKGREEPLVARRAVRVKAGRGGRGTAETLEPPFVGRAAELRLLKDALHATGREGRARLVSLVGQAGIGKSRLIREFENYVDGLAEDVYWHDGRSPSYGDGLSLWALGEMIRMRAGLQETDPPDVTTARLTEVVETYVEPDQTDWVRDRLGVLLGLDESARGERSELFAAARLFFQGIAARGATVLVFEDLHWGDPGLLEFIEELIDWSANYPLLVITVARPDLLDRRPDWGSGRRGFTSVYLSPMADDEMAELISGTVEGMPEEALQRIVEAAGGIPLFAVEMLRSLLADGRIVLVDETAVVAGELDTIEVPSSIQAVINARIDRLPSDERELVRDASVLGHSFTLEGLAAIREEEMDKIERRLGALVRHEILELDRDPRSPERGQYRWLQPVLREVAYGRISREDRRSLHLQVARYFREMDEPELAPIVASHFVSASGYSDGTDPETEAEMAAALRDAIARAQAIHAHEQVIALVNTAVGSVSHDVAVELHEAAALASVRLDDQEVADHHATALTGLASQDKTLTHRAVALTGWVYNQTLRSLEGVELMAPHLEQHPDLESDPALARIAVYLARALMLADRHDEGASLADRAIAAAEHFHLIDDIADAMITRGTAISQQQPHHGMALLRGALDLCDKHGLIGTRLRALINIGYASHDPIEGIEATGEAFEQAKRVGDRSQAAFVALNLAAFSLWNLDLDEAQEILDDPLISRDRISRLSYLARIQARRGQVEKSQSLMAKAAEGARETSDSQERFGVECAADELAFLEGRFDQCFETCVRLLEEHAAAPFISIAQAVQAAAFTGDIDRMRQAHEMTQTLPEGDFTSTYSSWTRMIIDFLDRGDINGFLDLANDLDSLAARARMGWPRFLIMLSVARLLPADHPARQELLEEALEIADGAGATGLREFALTQVP